MKQQLHFQYFKIKKDRQDYKGERYFKFNVNCESVVQVVVHPGEEKKGRNSTFGVYLINKLTFLTNYMSFYVSLSSKKEFDKNFNKVIEMLK